MTTAEVEQVVCRGLLGIEPTRYEAPHFKFYELAYLILARRARAEAASASGF